MPESLIAISFRTSADPPFTFSFRVKFYVPNPICLHEEYTRYQFFLQIRKDILEGRLPVPKSSACHLAGLALQCKFIHLPMRHCLLRIL
ncbi:FERM and FERM central and FERM adjacent (FA) domain containing protein [Fasciolopsis buskii]|uniref:FERM and FERM central and FERM adjacent (FA) domain containing protein n=1 Tax=Fasciolopsis buskii TaxID=27845 RepID=A0A8E0VE35_9TREM|nr:FERM and FERM central and FERM adjacent (FA) domain containing protein [Fasciolopsis buski]